MGFRPEDFFIGVVDFFAVLLPGALLSFMLMGFAREHVFGRTLPRLQGTAEGWVAFAFASYLFGHFVFLAGSYLDPLYDRLRRMLLPKTRDLTYRRAREAKERVLGDTQEAPVMNTFQWARAYAQLRYPAALQEVRRYEADSKFFRSLVIVLLVMVLMFLGKGAWVECLACLLLIAASLWRYAEQRWKAAQRAYEYVIAIESLDPGNARVS